MRTAAICLTTILLLVGCAAPPAANVKKKATPVPVRTPIMPEAVTIDKQTNVSFSSYSKDWPVDWQWIDPDEKYSPTQHDTKKGVLRVVIPTGKDLNLEVRNSPRYLKPIKGDFQIETRVKFLPGENYQGAGLLIQKDGNNFIRFQRAFGGEGGGGGGLMLDALRGEEHIPLASTADIPTDTPEVELRIVRSGRLFIAYWREDEDGEWREAGEFESDYPETVQAGVTVSNTAREVTAEFAYIRLLPGITEQGK